jgi:hypothetical protein
LTLFEHRRVICVFREIELGGIELRYPPLPDEYCSRAVCCYEQCSSEAVRAKRVGVRLKRRRLCRPSVSDDERAREGASERGGRGRGERERAREREKREKRESERDGVCADHPRLTIRAVNE